VKKLIIILLLYSSLINFNISAQESSTGEKYGKTLNLGLGIGGYYGYYNYVGRSLPVFHIDYELNVAKNFTLAPFLNVYTYKNSYYWGNHNYPYRYYNYHEMVIPMGVKGAYYFDKLLKASSKWDFYLASSVGFALVFSSWDSDYSGDKNYYNNAPPLFMDLHIGAEYHINNKVGAFLDLSSGISTIGFAIH